VKGLAGRVQTDLPPELRICGENLFAKHSIGYDRLSSYFLAFSIWNGDDCLGWDQTVEWCGLLDLQSVPVLWRGVWDETLVRGLWPFPSRHGSVAEGYVVRLASGYKRDAFARSIAKFVRPQHVQTDQHWMQGPVGEATRKPYPIKPFGTTVMHGRGDPPWGRS
jgi:hypothetical protein